MRRSAAVLAYALLVWCLCSVTMGVAQSVTTVEKALVIHALLTPIISAGVSLACFRSLPGASPLATAATFLIFVVLMDFFVVALGFLHSLAMFESLIGTWVPFASIFAVTYVVGWLMRGRSRAIGNA